MSTRRMNEMDGIEQHGHERSSESGEVFDAGSSEVLVWEAGADVESNNN